MKITMTGSLGNIGRPLATKLKSAGVALTVISHNENKREEIEAPGAKAAIGSVSDAAFLKQAFAGSDAVYLMVPPVMSVTNMLESAATVGHAYATAIRESGVKRAVLLSSIGADIPTNTGPIAGLYLVEQILNKLEDVEITFLRAGYFYTNFYNDIPMIKNAGILGANFSPDTKLPLVHPENIATAVAEELVANNSGVSVKYIVSDIATPAELVKTLGKEIGKPELPWVEFTDEQALQGMKDAGLPGEMPEKYMEMGRGLRNGIISDHFIKSSSELRGKTKLGDFAREFASKFNEALV